MNDGYDCPEGEYPDTYIEGNYWARSITWNNKPNVVVHVYDEYNNIIYESWTEDDEYK